MKGEKENENHRLLPADRNKEPGISNFSMNVDDFQEAYDFFIAHGFVNPRGDKVTDTSSSKATMLFSPSGFPINITQHIKKEDK